jgi:hypothetical protein
MPKDSPESQSKHADKIKVERALMEETGLTRSQIREGLQEWARTVEAQRVPIPPRDPPKPEAPQVVTEEVKQETERRSGGNARPAPGVQAGAGAGIFQGIVVVDGFAHYATISGVVGDSILG